MMKYSAGYLYPNLNSIFSEKNKKPEQNKKLAYISPVSCQTQGGTGTYAGAVESFYSGRIYRQRYKDSRQREDPKTDKVHGMYQQDKPDRAKPLAKSVKVKENKVTMLVSTQAWQEQTGSAEEAVVADLHIIEESAIVLGGGTRSATGPRGYLVITI